MLWVEMEDLTGTPDEMEKGISFRATFLIRGQTGSGAGSVPGIDQRNTAIGKVLGIARGQGGATGLGDGSNHGVKLADGLASQFAGNGDSGEGIGGGIIKAQHLPSHILVKNALHSSQ